MFYIEKYPIGSVIPDYEPDADICRECMDIAHRVEKSVKRTIAKIGGEKDDIK